MNTKARYKRPTTYITPKKTKQEGQHPLTGQRAPTDSARRQFQAGLRGDVGL